MKASVSVVVPTHNRRHVLPMTVDTILGQEDVDVELVVVDDGSADGTQAWLASVDDPRLRVVRHDQAKRLPAARNAGLAVAGAPVVAFCDDDDVWAPTKLAEQLSAMAASGARWSVTGAITVSADLRVVGHQRLDPATDVRQALHRGNVVPGGGSAVAVDTALAREVGGFDEELRSSEDWEMWIRLAERSPLAVVDRPMVGYRFWPGSMSAAVDRMEASYDAVMARHRPGEDPAALRAGDPEYQAYLARHELRARRRRAAAARHLRLATRHRLPRHVVHAALAAAVPGLAERHRARRELAEVPAEWRDEADRWLAPLRAAAAVPPG